MFKLITSGTDMEAQKSLFLSGRANYLSMDLGSKNSLGSSKVYQRSFSNFSGMFLWETSREQVKKAFCYQQFFWPFTVWINCSCNLGNFANSWPSASNFKSFSRSLEQFFLTVGQNNFGNKIPKLARVNEILDNPNFDSHLMCGEVDSLKAS